MKLPNFLQPKEYTFGACKKCHSEGIHFNIERLNMVACENCKTQWEIGSNLFSGWKNETEDIWNENTRKYGDYEMIEPIYYNVSGRILFRLFPRVKRLFSQKKEMDFLPDEIPF